MKISFSFAALQLASQWPAAAGAFSDYIPSKELVSADGILEVTLTVDLVVSLDMNRTAPGYNGISIGPTLRVKPGDTLRVTLINDLPDDDDKKTAYDRQLYDYVTDEGSDFVNVSRIINRLDYIGNIGWPGPDPITEPFFGYW